MSVVEVYEDIFEAPVQSLVVPVNVRGAMGAGLAKLFKERVPGLYKEYRKLCLSDKLRPDSLWRYKWPGTDQQVICLPTKIDWVDSSDRQMVISNLYKLLNNLQRLEITSLALPPVGCGLGGLNYWNDMRAVIMDVFSDAPIEVRIVLGKKRR